MKIKLLIHPIIKITLYLILTSGFYFASQLHVRIDDPVYDYLDRLSTQGVLPSYMNATLPLYSDYIADLLTHLTTERDMLSAIENKIDYLLSISDREWEDVVKKSPLKMEYDPGNKRLKELVKKKINT